MIVASWLPGWADSKASSALAVSTEAAEPELRTPPPRPRPARAWTRPPMRSLLAAADLAQNRGRLLDARRYLLDAVDRQPYNLTAWRRLMRLALTTADRRGAKAAGKRLLELDPIGTKGHAPARRPPRAVQRPRQRLRDRDRHAAQPGLPGAPAGGTPTP